MSKFASEYLGELHDDLRITDSYFGSSAYIDLIQHLQLKVSGADISFAAPLFFNAVISAGKVKMSDLFNIYRFEDRLYTLKLYGHEIKSYLEMSYAGWIYQMKDENSPFLQTSPMKANPARLGFKNFIFNFDSAAGIRYEVDVRKGDGERVTIISMAEGSPFEQDRLYTCCMTAYRANGGGELLTKGAELSKDEIEKRIVSVTDHDIRYYLMQYVREKKDVYPKPMNHWRFVPEDWVRKAEARETALLFAPDNNDGQYDDAGNR